MVKKKRYEEMEIITETKRIKKLLHTTLETLVKMDNVSGKCNQLKPQKIWKFFRAQFPLK